MNMNLGCWGVGDVESWGWKIPGLLNLGSSVARLADSNLGCSLLGNFFV